MKLYELWRQFWELSDMQNGPREAGGGNWLQSARRKKQATTIGLFAWCPVCRNPKIDVLCACYDICLTFMLSLLSSLSVHSTYPIYSVFLPFAAPLQSHNSYRSQKDWKHAPPIIMSFLSIMLWVKWTVSKITSPSYFSSCEIET